MPYISARMAAMFGIDDVPQDFENYIYDLTNKRWVFIGRPTSPQSVLTS